MSPTTLATPTPLTVIEYWNTLVHLEHIIRLMLTAAQPAPEKTGDEQLATIRIAERTLNSLYNNFMFVYAAQTSFIGLLEDNHISREQWTEFLHNRDLIADTISNIIEASPTTLKRYNDYCDHLKQLRALGCML